MADNLRLLAPIMRRLRVELERAIRESRQSSEAAAQQAMVATAEQEESDSTVDAAPVPASASASIAEGCVEVAPPEPVTGHDEARTCPICLRDVVGEFGRFRDTDMCQECVGLLRGS
jgi:hypothetical protein